MRKNVLQIADALLAIWLLGLAHKAKCAVDHINRYENSSFEKAKDLINNLHKYKLLGAH